MSPSLDSEAPSAYAPIGQVPLSDDPIVRVWVQPGSRARTLMKVVCTLVIVVGLVTAARHQTASSARDVELQPTRIIGLFDVLGYKCVHGSCLSSISKANYTDSDLSLRGCSKHVDNYHPDATGFKYVNDGIDGNEECAVFYDGYCNIFEDNGWDWSSHVPQTTCTKLITAVKVGWKYLSCTAIAKDITVSSSKSEDKSWTQSATYKATESAEMTAAGSSSHSSSQSITETAHLNPKDGKQQCVWQWWSRVHGPPSKGWIDSRYAEWVVTPSPDLEPKCTPGHFVLSDDTRQTCTSEKYELAHLSVHPADVHFD